MQNLIETNGLTAASDALTAAAQSFKEAKLALSEGAEEIAQRIRQDKAAAAARAKELDAEAAASTGVRAMLLTQRAKDCREGDYSISDDERAVLSELRRDAEEKLAALRQVKESVKTDAKAAEAACSALYKEAAKVDIELYRRWIDLKKYEKIFGNISC